MRLATRGIALGIPFLLCLSSAAQATVISLDSTSTYFHTGEFDPALDMIPIELITLGLVSGDVVRIRVVGDFSYCGPLNPECDVDTGTLTTAVFASSSTLLAADQLHRVVGAIDAGADYVTGFTWDGDPTDIPEDFLIFDVVLEIPVGATHLFVAPPDPFYSDNHDADGDYGVSIAKVPEPSALVLLGAGLALLAARRRR